MTLLVLYISFVTPEINIMMANSSLTHMMANSSLNHGNTLCALILNDYEIHYTDDKSRKVLNF